MPLKLTQIPERSTQPREMGLTMVMDKGLGLNGVEDFLSIAASYVDLVKLGFGTAFVTKNLREKLQLYKKYNIPVYLGGTMFETSLIRGQVDDYMAALKEYDINYVEISDGSVNLTHSEKCKYIEKMASAGFTVLSEVGSKDANKVMPPYKWIEEMGSELSAGSSYVIAEARESGSVGIYRASGEIREGLIQEILTKIPSEKVIWEAPKKAQQVYFINQLGCNANLGNIAPGELIALEAMRIGLRGDTFRLFLDQDTKSKLS